MSTNRASQIRKEFVAYQVCLKWEWAAIQSCMVITEVLMGRLSGCLSTVAK